MSKITHIVNFSGGLCSFWASHRVIQKHGRENTILLFADTMCEDEDLYRFNADASKLLSVPITRVADGRDPWELFNDRGLIANNRFPICSVILKRDVIDNWIEDNFHHTEVIRYFGFDWTEPHRVKALRDEVIWQVEAPMQEEPIWDKCRMQREADALGLKVSRAYAEGFPHDNCGGRCVRAGISHWVHLLKVRPMAYKEWETKELVTKYRFELRGIIPFSILKDRRGGVTKNLWLRDLRLRVEAGEQFTKLDWGGCGCGGAVGISKNVEDY